MLERTTSQNTVKLCLKLAVILHLLGAVTGQLFFEPVHDYWFCCFTSREQSAVQAFMWLFCIAWKWKCTSSGQSFFQCNTPCPTQEFLSLSWKLSLHLSNNRSNSSIKHSTFRFYINLHMTSSWHSIVWLWFLNSWTVNITILKIHAIIQSAPLS